MEKYPPNTPIILASKSQIRGKILRDAGYNFKIIPADIDESVLKKICQENGEMAKICAKKLAYSKAKIISNLHPKSIVIGADQLLSCDGRWFDKPHNINQAFHDLQFLQGKTHILHTAISVFFNQKEIFNIISEPQLTMHHLSDDFLINYCKDMGDNLCHSVGAYQIENIGIRLFSKIKGDYFAIMGMPIIELNNFLLKLGK